MRKKKLFKKINIKNLKRYQFRNLIAILICLFFVGSLSIGYAVLSQKLEVKGNVSLRTEKAIRIIKFNEFVSTNNAYEQYNPTHDKESITANITLPNLNSTATYTIIISNNSTLNMDLKSITNETYTNSNIVYELAGLKVNDSINPNQVITATITFRYNETLTAVPENESLGANIKFKFEEHLTDEYVFSYLSFPNKYSILSYSGSSKDLTIPSTYNALDVVLIDKYAFQNKGLTSVALPERLETINFSSFPNNQIKSLIFPETLKTISNEAFFFNSLEIISFRGKTPPTISASSFDYNFKMKTVCIPTDADIAAYQKVLKSALAFTNFELIAGKKGACTEIGTGEIEDNTGITCGSNAYQNQNVCLCHEDYEGDPYKGCNLVEKLKCLNVTYQSWSKSYIITGYNCANTNIVIPETYEGIKITKINKDSFKSKKIESVSIGNNIDTIDMYAFKTNNLTKVTIPSSVTSIVNYAFSENQLRSITFKGITPPTIGNNSFQSNPDLTKICVPPGTSEGYRQKLTEINILNTAEIYEDESMCQ